MRISDWSSDVCSSDLLPGQGWPLGSLIELLPSQPGIGEIRLLQPALASLGSERSVALVRPPYEPYFHRSEEHTSELQSLMRISYAVFCLKKKNINTLHKRKHLFTI